MFGNRQSGPTGLSINTSSANSISGSSGQPPKPGDLFGSVQQSKPAGSLFGAAATPSQPQNSLFGTSNSTQGGGSFGSATNTSQPQSNSLFGTANTTQSGGLFGSSTTTSQPQQNNSLLGGSLFGGQGSNNQTQTGGLFGGSSNQQPGGMFGQSSQPQNTSIFGSANTQQGQSQQQGGGLFGSTGQAQAQPQNGSIFGQTKSNSLFGSSTLQMQGQQQAQQQPQQQQAPSIFTNSIGQLSQQQQTVPGVRISINELRPTTRFNDLHEELQRVIENIDNFILEQMKFQSQCQHAVSGDDGVEKTFAPVPGEVQYAQTTLDAVQQALETDAQAIAYIRDLNRADQSDAKISFRAISTLRMPQQFQHSSLRQTASASHIAAPSLIDDDGDSATSNLVSYFANQINEMSHTIENFTGRLNEVEAYLNGMEVSMMDQMQQLIFLRSQDGGQKSIEDQVKELAAVLKEMQSGIGGVAGKLSGTREKVQEVVLGEHGNRIAASRARRY